ncbi:MAG: oligogalacturonate lyase family protein [Candidatus Sumerlaeia bacterium]|nr:oligogalacturonate lyase family protein [Candidatus Sumerlaeia bacterium]
MLSKPIHTPDRRIPKGPSRRLFLGRVAAVGGVTAAALSSPRFSRAAEGPAPRSVVRNGGRGATQNIRGEIKDYKDPKTGAHVRQLTGDGSNNVHPYFTSWAFVGDNADRTVFVSNRSGAYQWHLLEISAANLVQLTTGEKLSPNMACLARNGRLFYFDGPALHVVNVDTLEDRELYRVPAGFRPALPTCTNDGRYVAFAYCEETALSTETGRIYSTMHERYYQHPRSVIMRIDADKGEAVAAWGETAWISHVLIHPTKPNLILFCHEGGSTCVAQRMWIVDTNDDQMRKAVPLYPQKPGESCVHEYWTQQGDVGFQYSLDRERKTEKGVETFREEYNAFVRPDGTWIRQYLFPAGRPGHIQSNSDNTLVVGDRAYLGPDDKDGGQFIGLMTHVNGCVQVRRLAWHGTSWRTQASHGHPSFSPDDKWVIYNSDVEKSDNVYMAEVGSV